MARIRIVTSALIFGAEVIAQARQQLKAVEDAGLVRSDWINDNDFHAVLLSGDEMLSRLDFGRLQQVLAGLRELGPMLKQPAKVNVTVDNNPTVTEVIGLLPPTSGENHHIAARLNAIAVALSQLGQHDLAEQAHQRACALSQQQASLAA